MFIDKNTESLIGTSKDQMHVITFTREIVLMKPGTNKFRAAIGVIGSYDFNGDNSIKITVHGYLREDQRPKEFKDNVSEIKVHRRIDVRQVIPFTGKDGKIIPVSVVVGGGEIMSIQAYRDAEAVAAMLS